MVAGLSYHIVPGVYLAQDFEDGAFLPTVEGQNIAVSVDGEGTGDAEWSHHPSRRH